MAIEKKTRLDSITIQLGEDRAVRGVHVSNYVVIEENGVKLSDMHEVAPFDPARLGEILAVAPQMARILALQAEVADLRARLDNQQGPVN